MFFVFAIIFVNGVKIVKHNPENTPYSICTKREYYSIYRYSIQMEQKISNGNGAENNSFFVSIDSIFETYFLSYVIQCSLHE